MFVLRQNISWWLPLSTLTIKCVRYSSLDTVYMEIVSYKWLRASSEQWTYCWTQTVNIIVLNKADAPFSQWVRRKKNQIKSIKVKIGKNFLSVCEHTSTTFILVKRIETIRTSSEVDQIHTMISTMIVKVCFFVSDRIKITVPGFDLLNREERQKLPSTPP